MYKKILSTFLFFFCLLSFSDIQAGSFSYLNAVYHILLRSEIAPGLNVVKTGGGSGVVTSDTTIDCGTVCNEVFNASTNVTLTATPTAGSFFTGWAGKECSGIDPKCVVHVDETSATTVYAEFSVLPASFTENESNNAYFLADTVTFNIPIYGSVDATSDTDWYAFNTTGEDIVTILFDFPYNNSNDSNDWHVQLYSSNNLSTPLRDVYVNKGDTFNLDTTGDITYYLVVSKDVSDIITDYKVTIATGNSDPAETEVPITGTNDHLNATYLPFDTVMHGNLTDIDADQDWYKLQPGGSSTVMTQIEFSAPYSISKDWVVTVYADNAGALGQILARTAVTDGSVCYVALPNTSSIFYVMITDLTDPTNFEGRPYTLTVHRVVGGNVTGEIEPNNDSSTATSVDFSTNSLSGQLALVPDPITTADVVNDTDWFVFKATSTTMDFTLTSPETGNAAWTVSILETGKTVGLGNGQTISVDSLTVDNYYHMKIVREVSANLILVSAQYVITKQ